MSKHIFQCEDSDHVIVDASGEPVPHINETENIWCPVCEQDVTGTYLGQNISGVLSIGDHNMLADVELYQTNGKPYCIHCDGICTE